MLDLKALRADPTPFRIALTNRQASLKPLDEILQLDTDWRRVKGEADALKGERNKLSENVSATKKAGGDIQPLLKKTGEVSGKIKALDIEIADLEGKMEAILLTVPNLPHQSVPVGKDEKDNIEVRQWNPGGEDKPEPKRSSGDVRPHYEIGPMLGQMDFERGAKLAGSRFAVLSGQLARLERAIAYFMLETHIANGYKEVLPPYLVNSKTMRGTGQLPKFAGDLYRAVKGYENMAAGAAGAAAAGVGGAGANTAGAINPNDDSDLWLIPTAEVPLTNLHAGEVLEPAQLPVKYCALTPCFRSEAGNYQKDIKGLIRQHQFNKVELVKFSKPEESFEELEKLTRDAERILRLLKLPYRVIELCTGDMGFSAAKTYDIEVWLPSQDTYREISSCSNCADFQARRAGIKMRREGKNEFVHTLNGSGLAVGRTMVAILENYQDDDGIGIPEPLQDYMRAERIEF
ncbi:MAG: serine--tRNA ligase [Candidatus Micrarchaeota archaeon]|nr:serine--tRNA ligase [Candidatus Micrarchaeota archaeon]